jgi:hypothetical protein
MADSILDDQAIAVVKAANLPIGLASIEEIIAEEDSSEAYYTRHYQSPEWPGGASGVTIMLGYDLGYATPDKITKDLKGKISDAMLAACISCSGIHGSAAYGTMMRVRSLISIPFVVALDVFLHTDMPEWIATARHYLANTELLPPDCLGAIVSVIYNRGASFNSAGDRYREMRAIKADMASKNFADIPNQFRSMARLWPSTSGVHGRRYREAAIFEKALNGAPETTGGVPLHDTRWVQASLNLLGEAPPLAVDGSYGQKTKDAVRRYQSAYQLDPTGFADAATISKLADMVSALSKGTT